MAKMPDPQGDQNEEMPQVKTVAHQPDAAEDFMRQTLSYRAPGIGEDQRTTELTTGTNARADGQVPTSEVTNRPRGTRTMPRHGLLRRGRLSDHPDR